MYAAPPLVDRFPLPGRTSVLSAARRFAAKVLTASSRSDLAEMVLKGGGDDFPEVSAALEALHGLHEQMARQEEALRFYADPSFWDDDDLPGGALALHDKGEMARNVLAGKRPFFHRD